MLSDSDEVLFIELALIQKPGARTISNVPNNKPEKKMLIFDTAAVLKLLIFLNFLMIKIVKINATDSEIEANAKLANAHDFIDQFPNSYQTIIGERGATLSGDI